MAFEARKARWVVAGLGIVLVAVVLGFVGYAHYRAHAFLQGLPGRLGMNITQETNNVTFSQSYKGKTIFTVHAARQIQHKDGKVTLKDVSVEVYGRGGKQAGDAAGVDKIRGSEFEYDQKHGVLTAVGETFLDLVAPVKPGTEQKGAAQSGAAPKPGSVVHVKTSGLVYLQKERTASTKDEVEFQVDAASGGLQGKAVGASYAVGDDVLVLERQVQMQGTRDGKPVALTAGRAEFDRDDDLVKLETARYTAGTEVVAADHALVRMRDESTPERVDADGHVELSGAGRGKVSAQQLALELNDAGQPKQGSLMGGVLFRNGTAARDEDGAAREVQVRFDGAGRPVHALLTGGVEMHTRAAAQGRSQNESQNAIQERRLRSSVLELALGGGGKQPVFVRGAVASGPDGAVLRAMDVSAKGESAATQVRADTLTGRFTAGPAGKGMQLSGLDGVGRTEIQRASTGKAAARDTSTGDTLHVEFAQDGGGKMQLARARQQGGVRTVHEAQGKTENGRADAALYEAASDTLKMQGNVVLTEPGSELYADQVTSARPTGVSEAEGSVRVGYTDPARPEQEPVHVIAARAISTKATGMTRFTAAAGARVRMWQGGAQVEAPVIDLDRTGKRLIAQGLKDNGVRAVLPGKSDKPDGGGPVRIFASEMEYADAAREVTLQGPVRVESRDGRMTARDATVLLTESGKAGAGGGLLAGRVERMVGTGNVTVEQPGRKATGERLVYTAADGLFVLTGTKAVPPKLDDEARGMVTGASLRFKTGEESVVVTGADGAGSGRVHTETRVRQDDQVGGR